MNPMYYSGPQLNVDDILVEAKKQICTGLTKKLEEKTDAIIDTILKNLGSKASEIYKKKLEDYKKQFTQNLKNTIGPEANKLYTEMSEIIITKILEDQRIKEKNKNAGITSMGYTGGKRNNKSNIILKNVSRKYMKLPMFNHRKSKKYGFRQRRSNKKWQY